MRKAYTEAGLIFPPETVETLYILGPKPESANALGGEAWGAGPQVSHPVLTERLKFRHVSLNLKRIT